MEDDNESRWSQSASDTPLALLQREDLYDLSVEDLEERIQALDTEMQRCRAALKERGGAKAAADALFKS
ncbi:MAG: DUF1192 domain-containing protein [Pseudomonadota bacterium]